MTPGQLVQNVLVGQGVSVSNVTYSGAPGAIGYFNGSNSSIGLDEGIILTTGTINSGPDGPYGPNNKPNAGLDNSAGGFGPLTNIVNKQTFNAAVLEFDFVPQSDTVRFEYVFGSEEYPEWVGDQFNDVFAFFISGPGISGNQNMAIIPGTTQPVAINNVNNGTNNNGPCTNCQFYVNNGTGNNAPFNTNPFFVQYDGFTTPLQAISPVQCGETYRLIIAIADVGDAIFDSGIFLSANSLSSEQPVNVTYELSSDPYGDGKTLAQGCTSATVTVSRSGDVSQPLGIPLIISGSAIQGVDHSNLPTQVNFNAGQTTTSFTIDALVNPNLQGTVDLLIEFAIQDPCGNDNFQSVELFFNPTAPVELTIDFSEVVCPGEEIELFANAIGGGGNYTYLWNTGATTPSIFVSPNATEEFTVTVVDDCLNQEVTVSALVEVPIYEDLEIQVTSDIVEQCPFVGNDLEVVIAGGVAPFTIEWLENSNTVISQSEVVSVAPSTTTSYQVTVTDVCGAEVSGFVTITILSPPLIVDLTPETEICPGESIELVASPSGGFGDYYYLWPHSGETTASVIVTPEQTTSYTVVVRDDCNTFEVKETTTVFIVKPEADFLIISEPLFIGLPVTFQNLTNNGVFYDWRFGDGNFSTAIHPNNIYDEPGDYEVLLVATDAKGCQDSITKLITIKDEHYIYVPNAFTPDGDRFNNVFYASTVNIVTFNMLIFNRWGELIFESNDPEYGWDGTYNGTRAKDGTYIYVITYQTINDDPDTEHVLKGFVTLLK
jgi:gliding motility-associated-like protein